MRVNANAQKSNGRVSGVTSGYAGEGLMGICASCLGLKRHPSWPDRETDPLLDHQQQSAQYGAVRDEDAAQPDEEELRMEREALEQITAEASENMIDVSHTGTGELGHPRTHTNHERHKETERVDDGEAEPDTQDAEEAAWLQSLQDEGLDSAGEVKGLQSGTLVMDIGQLRGGQPHIRVR
ncbi:Late endosomal/lysosomal adaptor and MAPK and MTOR activator [Teratosphaeria destructans]|uniref:Late endosomal/lysosomal adaptor and MAPK and MTOR activator n=1 Tax=Teratosphaeria destructans TaxID=418781 RepID=A0A9W7W4T1_9PEZI|nr:Late endosomal/lysosomal adaptor and MAPK and MTOR activator [Teratosphaeria destructans]